ncbi:hypothetical protein J437_LFUL011949 [Ladona fulva]|uniref:Uncharacterized protein n=1 Tax=Ladona fulva TaxID=123851 RepID=A0A8K0P4H4_LADFU|nr:hypothetical protein J437_LFUL011949 [Ladona fulva]
MVFKITCNVEEDQKDGSGGIRTHASEETGALNQRLRPLGHATDKISHHAVKYTINFCGNAFATFREDNSPLWKLSVFLC